MQNITKHTAVWMTVAAAAAAAHGGLIGGDAITVSSATGFVPVVWDEPTNGFGVVGDSKHHDGSVTLPFAGWSDFGLLGDQRITITWNFTAVEPDRYLWWTITPRQASNQVLAGMGWDAMQWSSMGAAPLVPGMTGWAQVNGRDELPISEKVKLDVAYLERKSLWFDVRILWLTFVKVLRRDGVSH